MKNGEYLERNFIGREWSDEINLGRKYKDGHWSLEGGN